MSSTLKKICADKKISGDGKSTKPTGKMLKRAFAPLNYRENVEKSFCSPEFSHSISLLAYVEGKVVGRIDSGMIATHFEGSRQAYLDWVCVLKSHRHQGIAQKLMKALREQLKQQGITTLVGLIASNEEAQRFYRSLPDSKIQDEGIWVDIL